MAILVAFPVLVATLNLHLDKGKRWNALEHLLLHSVCARARSAPELAVDSRLPRRLVIEVMIRLMRVGWVELVSGSQESGFRATIAGQRVVRYESLPAVTRALSRRGSFAIDQVSGTVFRARDLTLYTQARIDKVRETALVLVLPREIEQPRPQVDEVISTLLEDDEHCKGVEPSGGKLFERFAVARVSGQVIDGLPARAPELLKQKIYIAARSVAPSLIAETPVQSEIPSINQHAQAWDIVFSHQDLVLGGPAHKVTLELLLEPVMNLGLYFEGGYGT